MNCRRIPGQRPGSRPGQGQGRGQQHRGSETGDLSEGTDFYLSTPDYRGHPIATERPLDKDRTVGDDKVGVKDRILRMELLIHDTRSRW